MEQYGSPPTPAEFAERVRYYAENIWRAQHEYERDRWKIHLPPDRKKKLENRYLQLLESWKWIVHWAIENPRLIDAANLDWLTQDRRTELQIIRLSDRLSPGGNLDEQDADGNTALMLLLLHNSKGWFDKFLAAGARKDLRNKKGENIFDLMRQTNCQWISPDENPDEVAFESCVDGKTLREVFSFVSKERFSFLLDKDKKVEGFERKPFSALEREERKKLSEAFNQHRARGGRLQPRDVFLNSIPGL